MTSNLLGYIPKPSAYFTNIDVVRKLDVSTSGSSNFQNNIVNVKQFGAVGNGVTDDFTSIRAALDSITTGGTLYFPKGTYIMGSQLTIFNTTHGNISIIGEGMNVTIVKRPENAGTQRLFDINQMTGGTFADMTV